MAPSLPQQVLAFIRRHDLIRPSERLLVAVSGGPDSTALLYILQRLTRAWPVTLGVAHFDHGLRGEASRAEAVWVAGLAESLGLPCHLGAGAVREYQQEQKVSCQVAARELRHRFLRQVQAEHGYQKIALGHTADDQLELFLLRLLRGTGPAGLLGMQPHGRGLIRPLLECRKADLLAWLHAEGLTYQEDSSNLDRRYRRNHLRLDLVPRLLAVNPRLPAATRRLQAWLAEQEDFLASEAQRAWQAIRGGTEAGGETISRAGLQQLHPTIQKRVLLLAASAAGVPSQRLSSRHLTAMQRLALRPQGGGAVSLPGNWQLVRMGDSLHWLPPTAEGPPDHQPGCLLTPLAKGSMAFLNWQFTWQLEASSGEALPVPGDSYTIYVDFDRLHLPLRLRQVQPGDRLRPLGLDGTKKVQDILVDAKIPRHLRLAVPVMVSGEEIIWVVGLRQAETAKVTAQTRRRLRLSARPHPALASFAEVRAVSG
jgi:tRNA(Ile)-lysidine synthase